MLKDLQTVDGKSKAGEDVDSTLYDEEGDEFDEDAEDFEDEDFDEGINGEDADNAGMRGIFCELIEAEGLFFCYCVMART